MMQPSKTFVDVKNVVAVDQHVPDAGAIVWWRLSGRVDYEALRATWLNAGLDPAQLLSPCSASTALRRAANDLREKRLLVRPLGKGGGFAIVRETTTAGTEEELAYKVLVKVTLDAVDRPKIEPVEATEKREMLISNELRAAFDRHLNELEPEDFSHWLVKMMPQLDAVSLRDTGGVYFCPPASMARLGEVVGVLRTVTEHVVNRVPAMKSDEAVNAILDAVQQEAEQEAARMEREIEAAKLGERGLENRLTQCDEVESKVARYEELLGTRLESIRERLDTLRAALSFAALKARAVEPTA